MIYNKAWREVLRGWTFLAISAAVLAFLVVQFELREDDLRLAILEGSFPEASNGQPAETPTLIEESVSPTEDSGAAPAEEQSQIQQPEEEIFSPILPLPQQTHDAPCRALDNNDAITAQHLNDHGQREVELEGQAQVFAPVTGEVVKIFNHPTMGLTVYLVNESGTECLGLGGFSELASTVTKGRSLSCGTLLGTVPRRLVLERYQIAPGKEWWQGKRVDPSEL